MIPRRVLGNAWRQSLAWPSIQLRYTTGPKPPRRLARTRNKPTSPPTTPSSPPLLKLNPPNIPNEKRLAKKKPNNERKRKRGKNPLAPTIKRPRIVLREKAKKEWRDKFVPKPPKPQVDRSQPPMETFLAALEEYRPERPGYFSSVRASPIDVPSTFLQYDTPLGKSLEAKSREFMANESERICREMDQSSDDEWRYWFDEIKTLGQNYGTSQTYWRLWQRFVGRFPHQKLRLSELGIHNPMSRNAREVFQHKERAAFVTEVLDSFHHVRHKRSPIPRMVSPEYVDTSVFYAVPAYNKDYGHIPKEEKSTVLELTLNKYENGECYQDRVTLTTLGNFSLVTFPAALLWWYDKDKDKIGPHSFQRRWPWEFGFGVNEHELADAIVTYKQAATTGHPAGLHNMGSVLRNSFPSLAFDFFMEAANRGDVDAICNLGLAFMNGQGIPQDDFNGLRLMQAAAVHYHPGAMYHVGVCALLGIGAPIQPELALRHWGLAARYGCPESAYHIGRSFLEGFCLPQDDEMAFEWFCRAAEYHHPFALFYQAVCYRHAIGTEAREDLAMKIFHRSADCVKLLDGEVKVQLTRLLAEEDIPVPLPRKVAPLKGI